MRILDRARRLTRATTVLALGGALLALGGTAQGAAATGQHSTPAYRAVCADSAVGSAHCDALSRTDLTPRTASELAVTPDATVPGYSPANLQSAYNLASAAASNGAGQTVAIVDAYNDPNANSDLAVYRSQFGLPACTVANGCLSVMSQTGSTTSLPSNAPATDDWTFEESLDMDMVSAICPNCHILLVEANSTQMTDLGTAVNEAVAQGAKFVSNSYGGSESSSETSYDTSYYNHPGVVVTASSGDSGYGLEYPAASPDVTAVGGTSLSVSANARGWAETVWSTSSTEGTGSGCSAYEAKPTWQLDTGCAHRTVADVSADADPATGVAVYDSFNSEGGWNVVGGTSVASPIIASVYALAGAPAAGTNPASYPYARTANLYDVTAGATATCTPAYLCTAEAGYDGPTGLGTPDGTAAFTAVVPAPANGTFVEVQGTAPVYRIVGGAPVYVSTWTAFGGAQPVSLISQSQFNALSSVPANGTFIEGAQSGQVYRITGGAPVYVSTWTAFGGAQPYTAVDQTAIDDAGTGGVFNHLNQVPANGTLITGAQSGNVYVIAGGAAVYVSTWAVLGGSKPTTVVDQTAIDDAGTGGVFNHLNQVPTNGTFIQGEQSGNVYVIAGGAPVYVSTWTAFGGAQPVTVVDQTSIDNAGSSKLYSHLDYYPVNGTFLLEAQTGAVYIVNNGHPTYVPSWAPYGGPQPTTTIDQAAVTNAGAGGVWSHLS